MLRVSEGYGFDDLLLVPQHGVLESRKEANIGSELLPEFRIAVPIVSANMPSVTEGVMAAAMFNAGGFGIIHRFCTPEEQAAMFDEGSYFAGAAIGLKDGIYRTQMLVHKDVEVFCLDVAHGDSEKVVEFIKLWRWHFPHRYLIAGNVATGAGAFKLLEAGADAIKVGIGPGAACTTREVTGFGVPQLSAIESVRRVREACNNDFRIIADGGIRNSGDIVKALAAGADTVMIGRLLAGCDEAPHPGEYFGNASLRINGHNAPEGIEGEVESSGPVEGVIKKLAWGIRSGISYAGARDIKELQDEAEWVTVSSQTLQESGTRV